MTLAETIMSMRTLTMIIHVVRDVSLPVTIERVRGGGETHEVKNEERLLQSDIRTTIVYTWKCC